MTTTLVDLTTLSDDDLEKELVTWAGRVNAGHARMLATIGEIDARGSWHGDGWLTCAHWLSVKLGLAPTTAHEHVRVARKLREMPLTAAEMAAGRLSFSQVRAITRIADAATEAAWLQVAAHATGAQLEKMARGVARAQAADRGEKPKPHVSWAYDDETGEMVLTMRCPAEVALPVIAALEAAIEDCKAEQSSAEDTVPDGESLPIVGFFGKGVVRMDGLLRLAKHYLEHRGESAQSRDRSRLRVYTDPRTGWSRLHDGELLPPAITAKITDGKAPPSLPRKMTNLGRLRRDATAYQRQILEALDGACCAFPGCTRRRNLHAHHIQWWSHGGKTDLENLVLLCSRHHTLVHDEVYRLKLLPDRILEVFSPLTGRTISRAPRVTTEPIPIDGLDQTIDPRAAHTHYEGDKLDLDYAVSVLCTL